jgi:predicted metal-dependent hydrolase
MEQEERITVKGKEFTIQATGTRGRYSRVVISGYTIRIKLPFSMRHVEVERTYREFKEWAINKLEKMDHSKLEQKPRFLEFSDGQQLALMGKIFTIRINEATRRTSIAKIDDNGGMIISLAAGLDAEKRKEHVYTLSRKALSKTLLPSLKARVDSLNSTHFNFRLNDLALREQSTRWGSCSRRGSKISLNFRLLFAPEEIMDYVIIHELAHLKEPNHSERFWNLVRSAVPDFKSRRKWLNENGKRLGVTGGEAKLENQPNLN